MKQRVTKHRKNKIGQAPGALVHIGDIKTAEPLITLIEYDVDNYCETRFKSLQQGKQHQPQHETLWLNVHGLQDISILEEIGRRFKLHPLVLEDILNTDQRPKVDDYGDYLFMVARLFEIDGEAGQIGDRVVQDAPRLRGALAHERLHDLLDERGFAIRRHLEHAEVP